MNIITDNVASIRIHRIIASLLCFFILNTSGVVLGQNALTIANPDWNITLTDFGYSDFLLDNTPGFEGREYLSGEWAAAIAYEVDGESIVTPQWLEPYFLYPNWDTLSSFTVISPITQTALNADGLPIAESVIANTHLQVTLRHEMIDTVSGIPMGLTPASSADPGKSISSDRYVLKQTCSIKNISGSAISNVQLFQFLHSLNAQRGLHDNRLYAGALSEYQYDLTEAGVDPWAISTGSSSAGLEDFISFHAGTAPSAFEIGYYGIEGNGIDDHFMGKPSDGVHLSVENNWQSPPYSSRQGTDNFNPAEHWVSGAQRWNLGNLNPNQTVVFDILLSLRTGTRVTVTPGSSGGCNGGSSVPGGLDFEFDDVDSEGSCFGEYSKADEIEISRRIAGDDFEPITFFTPGYPVQIWKVEFSGNFSGKVHLTFAYDPTVLPAGFDESSLCIYQLNGGVWEKLTSTIDLAKHTITVSTGLLSWFALGADSGTSFNLNASEDPPGSGTITGSGSYVDGSSATIVALANPGFVFSQWTENSVPVSSSPGFILTIHDDHTLVANFAPVGIAKAVATSANPPNGGTTSGDGAYAPGSLASVVATANSGYKFSKWQVNGVTVGTSRTNTFTVSSNVTLLAKFKPVYAVDVTPVPENGGEVEADPFYEAGELAKLKAKPNPGYCFVNWTQNELPVSTASNYQFNVTASRSLEGHFAAGHRIDSRADPLSGGTAGGSDIYPEGAEVILDAQANPGYVFLNWTENGLPVSTSPSFSLTSDSSRTLVANFIAQPELMTDISNPESVTIVWPAAVHGWVLQESEGLGPETWVESAQIPNVVSNQNHVTVDQNAGVSFYRLYHP